MHDRKSLRLKIRERLEDPISLSRVGHVSSQRPLLELLNRLPCRPDQIIRRNGLSIAEVMEEVRAEQGLLCLFKQHAGILRVFLRGVFGCLIQSL